MTLSGPGHARARDLAVADARSIRAGDGIMVYGSMAVRRSLLRSWRRLRRPTLARLLWASLALHVIVALGVFTWVTRDPVTSRPAVPGPADRGAAAGRVGDPARPARVAAAPGECPSGGTPGRAPGSGPSGAAASRAGPAERGQGARARASAADTGDARARHAAPRHAGPARTASGRAGPRARAAEPGARSTACGRVTARARVA